MRVTEISVPLVSLSLRAHNLALLYQLVIPANPGYLYTDKSGLAVIPDLTSRHPRLDRGSKT